MKHKPLRDQVLVVTGATSGNGLAITEEAVRRGAAVVAVAREAGALERLRTELSEEEGGCGSSWHPSLEDTHP